MVAAFLVAIIVIAVGATLLTLSITPVRTTTTPSAPFREFSVLESRGICGTLEKPELSYVRVGDYVLLIYREQADSPCYRHTMPIVTELTIWPPIIVITLNLERTSDICVKCVGVIETILRVGPLRGPGNVTTVPDGTKIDVNGLEVVVSGLSSWLVSPTVFLNQTVTVTRSIEGPGHVQLTTTTTTETVTLQPMYHGTLTVTVIEIQEVTLTVAETVTTTATQR